MNRIAKLAMILSVFTALVFIAPSGSAAQEADGDGVIFGQIVNGTTDSPVPEASVSLSTFAGGTLQEPRSTITDEDGHFEFPGVSTDPEAVYAVSTSYFNIAYSTGRVSFEEDSVGLDITLDVYEPTTDQSLVHVASRGLIITDVEPARGELGLLDIYLMGMEEDRALVADDEGRSLIFPVPRNATRVTPLSDETYDMQTATIEGATVYGTEPMLPGDTTITLSYTVPYTADRVSVELQANYPTDVFRLLIPISVTGVEEEVQLEAPGFEYTGQEQIGPQTYNVWETRDVSQGDRIQVAYTDLVHSQIEPNTLNKFIPATVATAATILAIVVIVWIVRGRRLDRERPVVLVPHLATSLESRREDLIEQLRALETANQQGLVDEEEYPDYRRYVLEQIRQVNRQLRGEGVEE
ncbi:MAG: carboxypeptidase-like regulatory domain-containing protein [Thermomicrobiales bacterium]